MAQPVSPDATIPVIIERAVIAPTGCSLAMGFLAAVPAEQRAGFQRVPAGLFCGSQEGCRVGDSAGDIAHRGISQRGGLRPRLRNKSSINSASE